jgi:peptide methionine sulfoxide reductase MsrB
MNENEILARGIVAGMSIVLPFLGIALARWHSWKGWSNFWQMMHKDLQAQNDRLFRALKRNEDKCRCFESKLNHIDNKYKPVKEADK